MKCLHFYLHSVSDIKVQREVIEKINKKVPQGSEKKNKIENEAVCCRNIFGFSRINGFS